jgi:hypothetical protein
MICKKYSCRKLIQYSQGNNVLDATALNMSGFLLRDTCVSSTQQNRPFWKKECPSTHWKIQVAGSIPLATNSILTKYKCARMGYFYGRYSFCRDSCVSSTQLNRLVLRKESILTLKHLSCRKYFFQKLTQLFQGNNLLNPPSSNTDGFLQEIHFFLHLTWIGLFETKWVFLFLKNSDLQEVLFSKTNSILTGKQSLDVPAWYTDGFLLIYTRVSSTQLNRSIFTKQSLYPSWNT